MKQKSVLHKYIDKLMKEFPRTSVGYYPYLKNLSGNEQVRCLPSSITQYNLAKLLCVDVTYKMSFKSACDTDHPLAKKNLLALGLSEEKVVELLELTKTHNGELQDYFKLFEEDIDVHSFSRNGIISRINQISKDSEQGTIVSHPVKMTNSACKYPRLWFEDNKSQPDGFVRTGNSAVHFDLHINATKLKVFKFLALRFNGRTILEIINKKDIPTLSNVFSVAETIAKYWVENFAKCLTSQDTRTNSFIRQVYFPVGDSYHQLSLLQPSGLVFALKDRIDHRNSRSIDTYLGKEARDKKSYYEPGYSTINNLTVTKHGGDHPKNISGLNNKHQSYYLLSSCPPQLEKRDIRFPIKDFFTDSIRFYDCRESLQKLHGIFKTGVDSVIPRKNMQSGRDHRIEEILDAIMQRMWALRAVAATQYRRETSQLKKYQKIWLCTDSDYQQQREQEEEWLNRLCREIANWIDLSYRKIIRKPVPLGKAERDYLRHFIATHREALR